MWLEQRPQVGTLRIRGANADVPALRLAVSGRLQTAELALPATAPPSAILLVRKLDDPLPGRFPSAGAPAADWEWNRAARNDLASFYRIASRPHRCELPLEAPAIVFRDRSELIATAAFYLALGGQPFAWWWPSLTRLLPSGALASVGRLLAEVAREVPAALAELFDQEQEGIVLARLEEVEARAVLERVVEACSLGAAAAESIRAIGAPTSAPDQTLEPQRPAQTVNREIENSIIQRPPWRDWLPASRTRLLGPHRELLLATALGLRLAPSTLRRQDFWRRAAEWRLLRTLRKQQPERTENRSSEPSAAEPEPALGRPADLPRSSSATPNIRPNPPELESTVAWHSPKRHAEVREAAAHGSEGASRPGQENPRRASRTSKAAPEVIGVEPVADPTEVPDQRTRSWSEAAVESELGGAFYLVNVMTALGLPEIFEDDWRLASSLGGWGTIDAMARAFAGELEPSPAEDPLWTLFARLDGREPGVAPSFQAERGDDVSPDFAIPARWQADLGLEPSSGAFDFERPLLTALDAELRAWLRGAAPFVARALARATGIERTRELAELLRFRARIYATATHVDIVASLAEISLTARRSGLDRDPGWVPALGRVIQFHFR